MSAPLFKDDILFYQRLLKGMGLYQGVLNGKWTEALDRADQDFLAAGAKLADDLGRFDARSEGNIATLHLAAQKACRKFLAAVKDIGFDVRVISGTRTFAEQDALFRKGRFGHPPPKVTNARGGQSNHNFGIAWDVGVFVKGKYILGNNKKEIALYEQVAAKRNTAELEWGGEWVSFRDTPHYQLRGVGSVSVLVAKLTKGATLV